MPKLTLCGSTTIAPISLLLASRRPSAIRRFVPAIVVDSIERMIGGWRAAHVLKECVVGVGPSVADCNPPSSVARVGDVPRQAAPLLHVFPDSVFPGLRVAVGSRAISRLVRRVTSATERRSPEQTARIDLSFRAAIAAAYPMPCPARTNYGQPAKSLAFQSKRDSLRHFAPPSMKIDHRPMIPREAIHA